MLKFQVTPLQLNRFSKYIAGVEGFDEFDGLIDYLNNGPTDFEAKEYAKVALFKDSVLRDDFSSLAAKDAKSLIPSVGSRDIPFRYNHNGLEIFGRMDFMGFGRGIIIDVVERYNVPYYLHNHFNWIMRAWKGEMFKRLDYVVNSREGVCRETYTANTYSFSRIADEADQMRHFLDQYAELINNPQITNLKYA